MITHTPIWYRCHIDPCRSAIYVYKENLSTNKTSLLSARSYRKDLRTIGRFAVRQYRVGWLLLMQRLHRPRKFCSIVRSTWVVWWQVSPIGQVHFDLEKRKKPVQLSGIVWITSQLATGRYEIDDPLRWYEWSSTHAEEWRRKRGKAEARAYLRRVSQQHFQDSISRLALPYQGGRRICKSGPIPSPLLPPSPLSFFSCPLFSRSPFPSAHLLFRPLLKTCRELDWLKSMADLLMQKKKKRNPPGYY